MEEKQFVKNDKNYRLKTPMAKTCQVLGSALIWQACTSPPLLIIDQQLYMDFYSSTGFFVVFFLQYEQLRNKTNK